MMKSTSLHAPFARTVIASSLLTFFVSAQAQDQSPSAEAARKDLITPHSRVEAGLGYLTGETRRFGQYNGLNDEGVHGLLNLNLVQRDDTSGTWLRIKGRNLGLDSRDIRFEHERQGDWGYFFEYSQLPRFEPLIVNTGLAGIGTGQQTVSTTAAKRDVELKMDHDVYSVGVKKALPGGFEVRASFKQDEKHGDRMYGRGNFGTATNMAHEFLAEPLDRTTRLWDVVVSYVDPKLQLSGGYSGSSYDNFISRLSVAGGSALFTNPGSNPAGLQAGETVLPPAVAFSTLALPLSNQAHQFHLSGGYNFSDSARTTFKASHSIATQDEPLVREPGSAPYPGAANSLDGKRVTTLAFADLNLRPAEKLDLTASVRFEDRDDQTPSTRQLSRLAPSAFSGGVDGFNLPRSLKQMKESIEAGYQLSDDYRLTGTLEHEQISRNVPPEFRRIAFRAKTDEILGRLELRGTLSDTLSGSFAYIHSDRGGSEYVNDTKGQGSLTVDGVPVTIASNQMTPLLWADRRRDKLRITGDWLPNDQWSLQFLAEASEDRYSGRTLGPRNGTSSFVSADVSYALSHKWKLTGWVSQERSDALQATRTDATGTPAGAGLSHLANLVWQADISNKTTAWGLGVKGKPYTKVELGADLSTSVDQATHDFTRIGGTSTAEVPSLPGYFYRQTSLKLFADYTLDGNSGVRSDVAYVRYRNNDWTWQNWVYSPSSDGTTVTLPEQETARFVGVKYYYRWR